MNRIYIKDLNNHFDKEVEISGYIDNIRNLQYVCFIILRDISGKVQLTIEKNEENSSLVEIINTLTLESTVKIKGLVKENEKVRLGGIEVIPSSIEVTSLSENELPINFKDLNNINLDTRLDYRFLDLRNDKNMLIFRLQSELVKYLREYLYENNFTEIHTPKFIGTASESGSEVFEVKYFDRKAYLAQSPQFYKQMAMASGFERFFEVAPCFRAENSNTSRHATEFTSFDVEMSYIDSYEDVMDLEEEMLRYSFTKLKENYGDKIKEIYGEDINLPKDKFPKVRLKDLYDILEKDYNLKVNEDDKVDLNAEAERLAGIYAKEKFNSDFIFIIDFPAEKRAFYHMRNDKGQLMGYDLLYKGVEITSGAQREHRHDKLAKIVKEKGIENDVKFYLEFFKYGCPPHGGFAIGLDRLTMLLLNIPSVKESMFLFRGPGRLDP